MAYVKKLAASCEGCGVVIQRRPGSRGPLPRKCAACWAAYRAESSRLRPRGARNHFTPESARQAADTRWAKSAQTAEGAAERSRQARLAAEARWAGHVRKPPKRLQSRRIKRCRYCPAFFATFRAGQVRCLTDKCRRAHNVARIGPYVSARRRGVRGGEMFTRFDLLERDGCLCGICGGILDPWLDHPHPRSVSVDHIVPVSRGGEHTRANTRATHLICNMRRGARDDSELTLATQAQAA